MAGDWCFLVVSMAPDATFVSCTLVFFGSFLLMWSVGAVILLLAWFRFIFDLGLLHIPVALSRGDMLKLDNIVCKGGLTAPWKRIRKSIRKTTALSMRVAWKCRRNPRRNRIPTKVPEGMVWPYRTRNTTAVSTRAAWKRHRNPR